MRRLTLRARLALAFAVAMAVVVAGIGLFVDLRVRQSLSGAVDQGLRARAVDVASYANQADNGLSTTRAFTGASAGFGQLITSRGRVFDATPGLHRRSLLSAAQLARARRGRRFVALADVPGIPAARTLVEPIRAQGQPLVLLVGTSLAPESGALDSLRAGLLIGCPIALALATLGGFLLAGAALAPVERMRARAAGLSADSHGVRLPIPAADDEISRLGRTMNEMLERLEHTRAREQRFIADASHELRTPLTLLKTELELALDGPRSPEALEAAVGSCAEEADRLIALSQDLLLLAQVDQGTLPVRLVALDGRELAARIAARFAVRAARESRSIVVDAAAGTGLVADPLRIEQALGNLVDNALRHGAGEVTVSLARAGEVVELAVHDEGPGLPSSFRADAFERFTRADGARGGAGTGLGLAIVAAIADAHGGTALIGDDGEIAMRLPASPGRAARREAAGTPHRMLNPI